MVKSLVNLLMTVLILSPLLSGCIFSSDKIIGNVEDYGIPGGLTLACLRSTEYKELILEIDYESGYEPTQDTINLLKQRLSDVCDKPSGITVDLQITTFDNTGSWDADKVRDISKETRSESALSGDVLRWHYLFPSGKYSDDSVLGVAVDASTVAIFLDSVNDAENCILIICRPSAEEITKAVTIHETGHLLGLVNIVYTSDIDHEDPAHPHHSNNEESVMYWAVETADVANIISGELPTEFDSADLSDLEKLSTGELVAHSQLWTP